MTVYTSGDWRVKPGLEREFVERWHAMSEWTSANVSPTIEATLLRDNEDPSHFVSFGSWPDEQTIKTWRSSEGFQRHISTLRDVTSVMNLKTFEIAAKVSALQPQMR